jgi:hypothetical protein
MNDNNVDLVTLLATTPLGLIVFLWLLVAFVAAHVAPDGRKGMFFVIALLFLGPFGIAAAPIAQPRTPLIVTLAARPLAKGRQRHLCPRCGAEK